MVLRRAREDCTGGKTAASYELRASSTRFARSSKLVARSTFCLPCIDLRDLQIRVRVVPLRRDVLKGQPERFALAGRERRQVEVHGFVVGSAGAQNADGKLLALRRLPHVVLERDLHQRVDDGLIASVGDGAIDIADGRANKILRRTCL